MAPSIAALFPAEVRTAEATAEIGSGDLLPAEASCIQGWSPKRRREFTAGRLCARRALEALGIRDFPVRRGEDRAPVWPDGIAGTLAHTDGYCGAAVVRVGEILGIGFDVEGGAPLADELVDRICTAAELNWIRSLPGGHATTWAKLVFSAKESTYKCYYPLARTVLDFHDVSIELGPEAGSFEARLVHADAPAAAGARTFSGRYRFGRKHVFTATTLRRGDR